MGRQLAGGSGSWCPELEVWAGRTGASAVSLVSPACSSESAVIVNLKGTQPEVIRAIWCSWSALHRSPR